MHAVKSYLLAAAAVGLALALPASGNEIEAKSLQFATGASSATAKGTLKGRHIVDFKLRARAGQSMTVSLKASNAAHYFNVLPPGADEVAIYNSSIEGNEWKGSLPSDGEYRIRTYLMRSAARRNESSTYTLTVGITGTPSAAAEFAEPRPWDAKVKGTPYHATGQVPCAIGDAAASMQPCAFGVIRGKPGAAEIHVTPPGALTRVLRFAGGKVTADGAVSLKAAKAGDQWMVEVNDVEQYRIPEAVISGG